MAYRIVICCMGMSGAGMFQSGAGLLHDISIRIRYTSYIVVEVGVSRMRWVNLKPFSYVVRTGRKLSSDDHGVQMLAVH